MSEMYQEYFNQGEVLLSAGNTEKAIEYFKKAEKEEPRHTELYISMGIAYANTGNLDEAEKIFKKALLVDKKCGEAYFHLGCVAGLKDQLDQAVKYLEESLVNDYATAQSLYTLGMMQEQMGNTVIALRNYNKALNLEAVRADIHLRKCSLLISEERREEAVEALDSMILNCPDYFEGYHLKCRTLCELERYEEASKVLDQGLELFPEEVGFKLDRAKILISQDKLDEADKLLISLEKENSEDWKREILLERTRIAGIKEDAPATTELLERAYAECRQDGKPDDEITYLLMSVYMTTKCYDKVIVMAKELMDLTDNETYINIAHFYLGEALKESGKTEEAEKVFEDTIKSCRATVLAEPAALDAYMLRSLSLNRLGRNEEALEMVDFVLALAPESPEIHSARAVILKDMGREAEMQQEVQKVNEIGGYLGTIMSAL